MLSVAYKCGFGSIRGEGRPMVMARPWLLIIYSCAGRLCKTTIIVWPFAFGVGFFLILIKTLL